MYEAEYQCSLHPDKTLTIDWCEANCPKYYSCDTVAWANDEEVKNEQESH